MNGVETNFLLDGTRIVKSTTNNVELIYRYVLNKLVGFCYNGIEFIYERNILGDIIRIYNSETGEIVGEYAYDGYGNHTIVKDIDGIATFNPFRYRGYFFDSESNFFYLNSRYYDSEVGRFISPDIISILDETKGQINGLNLYMYCADNPISYIDPSGYAPKWWQWIVSSVSLTIGVALCFVPGGQVLGVGLLTSGVTSMVSNIMNVAGVNSKVASIISSWLNIVSGIALCCIGFGGLGVSQIGSGIGGITVGYLVEAFGGNFETGAMIGSIIGGIVGAQLHNAIQTFKLARNEIAVIGEGMPRVVQKANEVGGAHYGGLKYFKKFEKVFGKKIMDRLGLAHNRNWIDCVVRAQCKIVDLGILTGMSPNYAMERAVLLLNGLL